MLRRLPFAPRLVGGGRIMPVLADDVAKAVLESIQRPMFDTIPVAGPEPVTMGHIIEVIAEADGMRQAPIPIPVRPLVKFAKLLGHRGKAVHAIQMLGQDRIVASPEKVGFHYPPTDLETGIALALTRYNPSLTSR